MQTFSGSRALGAGFGLIARHPMAVLVWVLVYMLLVLGPQGLMLWLTIPDFIAIGKSGETIQPNDPHLMAATARLSSFQFLQMGGGIVWYAVISGAVFRAMLEPQAGRFAFLRLGIQEFWLAVGWVMIGIAAGVVLFVGMIPVVLAGAAASVAGETAAPGAGILIVMFLLFGVLLWGWSRFCLGLPMSFATRQFRLFESWDLTRGQSAKIIGVGIALSVLVFIAQIVLMVIVGAAGWSWATSVWEAVSKQPETWTRLVPVVAAAAAVLAVFGVVAQVLFLAPLADIYRQLDVPEDELTAAGT
jgi:hypothetical protein